MNRHFDIFCNILQDFPYSSNKCDKTKEEASKVFGVGVRTVFRWISRSKVGKLEETKAYKPWKKVNPKALIEAVEANPGYKQRDFAKLFKATTAAICLAFKMVLSHLLLEYGKSCKMLQKISKCRFIFLLNYLNISNIFALRQK